VSFPQMELQSEDFTLANRRQPCRPLDLLEPRLSKPHTTVVIPLHDRIIFVSTLNCTEFPSWLSKIAQTLDAISGVKFLVGDRRVGKCWLPGTVRVGRSARV
jgi:hypothetical protein